MNINSSLKISRIISQIKDPLYKNSFFLLSTSTLNGLVGFIFWIIAARLYPQEEVGITTALISSMMLIVMLSGLGLDQSLIRFFPERNKQKIFSSVIITSTISSLIFGVIFIAGLGFWAPKLFIIREYIPIYLFIIVASITSSIIGVTFIALRKSNYYFLENLLFSSRILLLFPLIFLGAVGIFVSYGLPFIIGIGFLVFLPFKFGFKSIKIDFEFLKESIHFSAGSYLTNLLMMTPGQIVSIMTLNVLGANLTAVYFIAYSIAALLFMIPYAFSTSLFVEGSHNLPLRTKTLKSLLGIFLILVPLVLIFYFFGGFLLGIIGKNYVQGQNLLKVFSISSLFVAVSSTYISLMKIQKDIKGLILIGILIFVLTIGLSYPLMLIFGLIGVGYAWFIGYGLCSFIIFFILWKNKWI
jgi:O-antigen/teichoic acid export membrane protein